MNKMSAKMEATLKTFVLMAITAENGEVEMVKACAAGCGQPQLDALVRRNILAMRRPEGSDKDFMYWVA
jgi:hypothetical protein